MAFDDELVRRIRQQADGLLAALQLTAEEGDYAEEEARRIFEFVSETNLRLDDSRLDRVRAVATAAAVAHALITVSAWASKVDSDFPPTA